MIRETTISWCWRMASMPWWSPATERQLMLVVGMVLLVAGSLARNSFLDAVGVAGVWSGPDDPYLTTFRPEVAWLWRNNPHSLGLIGWAAIGVVGLGPWSRAGSHAHRWPTIAWGIGAVGFSAIYAVLSLRLMMLPLGLVR